MSHRFENNKWFYISSRIFIKNDKIHQTNEYYLLCNWQTTWKEGNREY